MRVTIHGDNQGVLGALRSGCSRSRQQNRILQRIVALCGQHKIWPTAVYVRSKDNPADGPSRGEPSPDMSRLPSVVDVPSHLSPFLSPYL